MDLLGKISKSIEKFLQKHSSKRTYWKTETWHGSSRQHLTGNGSMDLLKISKFVQLKNWKNSSKRACWKTETFKRDIFFSSFLRILHIYILSPPFFFRPPRRTTRFTDRNEQPAVKVDVHVLLLLLRSSSAFHRPTFDECCRGGKFAARSGKRKRFARAGRECVKRGKKRVDGHLPGFLCARNRVEKGGGGRGRNSRSVIFIAVSAFACFACTSLEGHPLSRFRGERSSCPRRRKRGGGIHESKMSFKIFWTRKWNLKYFWDFSRCSLFGEISSSTEKFSSLHVAWRDASHPASSRSRVFMNPSSSSRITSLIYSI